MKTLGELAQGRDNNFNLIRILAALAVLVSHSFAVSLGFDEAEPGRVSLQLTPGDVAVDVFFVISGFLVTGSLLARASVREFVWARVLRIYPALLTMVVVVVFVLGPLMSTISAGSYFASPLTWIFLVKNSTAFISIGKFLPGVFEDLPYPSEVNASLWTLFYEVSMYEWLLAFWLVGGGLARRFGTPRGKLFFGLINGACIVAMLAYLGVRLHHPGFHPFLRLFYFFFTGAALYAHRGRVPLSWPACLAVLVAMLLATSSATAFFVVYTIGLPYVVLFVAHAPGGALRRYNRLGDYSYGIYIFAYPIQQTLVSFNPGLQPLALIVASLGVTLPLAVISWHLIERPALSLRRRFMAPRASPMPVSVSVSAPTSAPAQAPRPAPIDLEPRPGR